MVDVWLRGTVTPPVQSQSKQGGPVLVVVTRLWLVDEPADRSRFEALFREELHENFLDEPAVAQLEVGFSWEQEVKP